MTHVALPLVLLLALGGAALAAPRGPTVSVAGEAEAQVAPDEATLTLAVETQKPTSEAAAADSARLAKALLDALTSGGVAKPDIETTGLSLYPVYSNPPAGRPAEVTGYRATESFSIHVREIAKAGALEGAAVGAGALYQGLGFDISDRLAREDALRVAAVENARHRAELYARGAGMKLGDVVSLVAEGAQPPAPRVYAAARMATGAAAPPIEGGLLTLRQSVNAIFALTP